MKNELVKAIMAQTELTNHLNYARRMKSPFYTVEEVAFKELKACSKKTARILWDMFTEWADITEAQTNDWDRFDTVYDSFEDGGYIDCLAVCDEYAEYFLNPLPVEFLETLEELKKEGKLHAVDIDRECSIVTIW